MPDVTCHEEVSRKGEAQPCEKPAVGWQHGTEGGDYPVCSYHTWGAMVPLPAKPMPNLAAVAKAIQEADAAHRLGLRVDATHQRWRCVCGCSTPLNSDTIRAHRYDAMARAAADALGVS